MSFLSDLQSSLSLTLELQLRKEEHPVVLSFVQGQGTLYGKSLGSFETEFGDIFPNEHSMKKERFANQNLIHQIIDIIFCIDDF